MTIIKARLQGNSRTIHELICSMVCGFPVDVNVAGGSLTIRLHRETPATVQYTPLGVEFSVPIYVPSLEAKGTAKFCSDFIEGSQRHAVSNRGVEVQFARELSHFGGTSGKDVLEIELRLD